LAGILFVTHRQEVVKRENGDYAAKVFRAETGQGLKEAKDAVEACLGER
jgi:ribosomal protein L7/L12